MDSKRGEIWLVRLNPTLGTARLSSHFSVWNDL